MKWFKHYTNASEDSAIAALEDKFGGAIAHGVFFKIVELCAAKYEGDNNFIFEFHRTTLRRKLGLTYKKIESILEVGSKYFLFFFKKTEDSYVIEFPKLSKYVHKDGLSSSKRRASGGPVAGQKKEEERKEEAGEKVVADSVQNFENQFDQDTKKIVSWLKEKKFFTGSLKANVNTIKKHFGNFNEFESWANHFAEKPKVIEIKETKGHLAVKDYFIGAILNECGAVRGK